MRLDYREDQDWPWCFEAVQDFQLVQDALTLSMSVRNLDKRPMPAGLGRHPYFASAEAVIKDATIQWPHSKDYLPRGHNEAIPDEEAASRLSDICSMGRVPAYHVQPG
jgi:aldose 1-epimerase